ncbi:RNA methyltransferase [uncultured Fibrobacter sp.]|uniref:THUMP domain-containing class I SAM-dependent RNA methyltransferase n=1 Tax=uncultured Fibrobacter sp. TaxID=261512 RepID=UPI0025F3AD15|nr:RNA methyltransferase [uncultured Fibrobacter sp.]
MDSAEKNSAFDKRLKRQVIGKPHRFLAVVPLGFEKTFVREMDFLRRESVENQGTSSLDIKIAGDGKVEFTAKLVDAWKVVAYSRIANRILMHIADFKAENFRELEKKAAEIPWELFLTTNHQPLTTIHVTCKHSRLYHSDAVAERLQKVIEGGSLPLAAPPAGSSATPSAGAPRNAPKSEASDLAPHTSNLYVTLIDDRCTLWLDLAGEELYKRGHERFVNEAPLKETIAAAILQEAFNAAILTTNHQPLITLIDPMSGSGTFSLEAAYMANALIPGKCRDFALKHQPAFKPATWNHIVNSANANPNPSLRRNNDTELSLQRIDDSILSLQGNDDSMLSLRRNEVTAAIKSPIQKIVTSDISEKAVGIITHNVECCPLANIAPSAAPTVNPQLHDFFSYTAKEIADLCGESAPVIVLNPPYGKRLDFDAPKLYTQIGKKFAELARELAPFGKQLTIAILAPKDDSRPGSKYTCTANLLHECPALDPQQNSDAKNIVTSHGGLSLNAIIARI